MSQRSERQEQVQQQQDQPHSLMTRESGCPVSQMKYSLTAGPTGPVVVSDLDLLERLLLFNRENIAPRKVHALGTGAYGVFRCTNDITRYTNASLFSEVGKQTKLITRFSGIFTEQGEPEMTRDPRGFALKFYTEQGNWDLLGINTPVFNVRDAKMGPDAIHACKRDPRTNMKNVTQTWDFCANHPESLHQFLMIYSDRSGTPLSYRHMDAYGCHTFSFINANKERFWVKFHIKSVLGARGFTMNEAKIVAGEDPGFLTRDLVDAIQKGQFPKWKMYCQIMSEEEGYSRPFTFDPTKVWKHADYPLIEIGEIEINKNIDDYFCETEQVAFSPANVVPGIGLSPDRLLMGRLLIYDDTQHHRLGPNFKQLPVNRPNGISYEVNSLRVGGQMNRDGRNHFPNYVDSDFGGPRPDPSFIDPPLKVDGPVGYYSFQLEGTDEDLYQQPGDFFRILSKEAKSHLCLNLASSFEKITAHVTLQKMIHHLGKCDPALGSMVCHIMEERSKGSKIFDNENLVKKIAHSLLA